MKRYNAGLTPASHKTRSRGAQGATRGVNLGIGSGISPSTTPSYPHGGHNSAATPARSTSQPLGGLGGAPARSAEAAKTLGGYNMVDATSARPPPSAQQLGGFGSGLIPAQPKPQALGMPDFLESKIS